MSSRRNRKRRRSQAFPVEEEEDDEEHSVAVVDIKDEDGPEQSDQANLDGDVLAKELEIWDAFREEHYEAIEQLPLSLHRQYILLHELDEQANGYTNDLAKTIKEYIALRRSLELCPQVAFAEQNIPASEPSPTPIKKSQSTPLMSTPDPLRQSSYFTRVSTPMPLPPNRVKRPQSTREMLTHTAWLSEEIQRASDEKVNLAQAAYDSVDRHIRLLDQAIKEQEANIALGVRPGTHLAPIILPDLVIPGSRPARAQSSGQEDNVDGGMTLGMLGAVDEVAPPQRRGKAGKKGRGKAIRDVTAMDVDPPPVRRLKMKGPVEEPPPVAPDEQRYCYCNQISFGEASTNSLYFAFFHLGCAGLNKPPADHEAWFCRDCEHLAKNNKRAKARQQKKR
ncbi:hypothetical protein HWV62_20676 [Athelia sp. TMB]|nr:hypothetical protein HWV62_20676 [Athelia sp. TMB]